MAFSEQEKQIIQYGVQNGKSRKEVEDALVAFRSGVKPVLKEPEKPVDDRTLLDKAKETARGLGKGFVESTISTARGLQQLGQGTIAAIDPTRTLKDVQSETGFKSLQGEDARQIDELLGAKSPEERTGKLAAFGAEILIGGGAGLLKRGLGAIGRGATNIAEKAIGGVTSAAESIANTKIAKGVMQTASDIAERVPRFAEKVRGGIEDAAIRAEKIKASTPAAQEAIKTGVDERIINTVQQADSPTIRAYKEMVDIADSNTGAKGGTLKIKERPEIVAGRAAEDQYKIIEKERKTIGSQIGEAVNKLSKDVKVPMRTRFAELDSVLEQQGIRPTYDTRGISLDFSGTKYTPAERKRIQELYELATEGGDTLTPRQIYDKDQLFSKLQRESRMEGVGDIIVDTQNGNQSLFRVFRDIYSNALDEVSPDDIRALNKQYRAFVTLQDDIENSIIKSGKYETTKNIDGAQFAQTNLRRLLSDAQSAADYREIVAEMDRVSRALGYQGANPEDLITFATELRRLYPEVVPPTGFSGGIRTGISDIAGEVLKLGAPDTADKQKALKALIDSLLK